MLLQVLRRPAFVRFASVHRQEHQSIATNNSTEGTYEHPSHQKTSAINLGGELLSNALCESLSITRLWHFSGCENDRSNNLGPVS